jgi:chromosome segregation ATPase
MPADVRLTHLTLIALALSLAACAGVKRAESTPAAADAPQPAAIETPVNTAERQLQQAMQAAQPRGGNLARARTLLEALVASTEDEARAVQPYAKSLLEQVIERQRLDAANVKLTQQLERSSQQLKDSQGRADELQRKLDALADIERSLPPARIPSRGVPR